MRCFIHTLAILICSVKLSAQPSIAIGDKVPDITFNSVLNHSSANAKLSEFKGKLVILDFWATWCTACLHSFPKMDSLQKQFNGNLKVLLVNCKNTGDDFLKVQSFLTKWEKRTGKKLSLTTIVNDTVAEHLFRHQLIPHYVWISSEGKFLATSGADKITAENISLAIGGLLPSFAMKKDQDMSRPIFSCNDLPLPGILNYSVFVKGWFDGLPSGNTSRKKDSTVYGYAFTNTSLLDMYSFIAKAIAPSLSSKQIIALVKDSSDLFPPPGADELEAWYATHAYSLEVDLPVSESKNIYTRMLTILNESSGYEGKFERKKINCLVLKAIDPSKTQNSNRAKKGGQAADTAGYFLRHDNVPGMVSYLNSLPSIKLPVINETGYEGKLDLLIRGNFTEQKSVRENLLRNGFSMEEEEREIEVFTLIKN